ncbi:MAG TPA: RNA polymerase sigma factor [Anaerolineales bacterium]|nr:RNA polymerase sigma factor [Anaerolineales bacterium]
MGINTAQLFFHRLRMLTTTPLSLFLALAAPRIAYRDTAAHDAELAHRAGRDPEAFSELYQRYLPGVYRYHLARTGQVQEAEDLTAQTFLTAWEAIGNFRGQGSFAAWLFGIASHKLADHYRRQKSELPLELAETQPSPDPLPEEAAVQRLEMRRVARVLRLLSPERAEALVLVLFGGLSMAEAAQTLGKSEAAVKMLIHRGLAELKERLAVHLEVR